ncbi:MAG: efflux RND transporter periplasmic adaptor subunit [Chitinophagales bacterium]|nr:efflux RND transporter periplasmic adaptor subunit [Bacteroidota bacterium]MCB9042443.1 efflux RND transporter periplasmic adaptor subunit [Chitinophagales bacterium]
MKNITLQTLLMAILLLSISACGSKSEDPIARLQELKSQQQEIEQEIQELEKQTKDSTNVVEKFVAVEVQPLQSQKFSHFLEIQGEVDAPDNIGVSARTPGIVENVMVVEGQQVSKGDVLAVLDDEVFQQSLEELHNSLDFARTIYQKQQTLWNKNIGSEVQYLQAKNNVESIEKKLLTLQKQADLYKVISPISGTIDQVNVKVGEGAAVGMPAFRVVNLSGLRVKADIAENYAGKIKQGDPTEVFFPDLETTVNGKISTISKIINPINRSFEAEVKVSGVQNLRPNMMAVVKIKDYNKDKTLVIPINSIQNSEEGDYVFVAEKTNDQRYIARKKLIETGFTQGDKAEVKSGLNEGDLLIVTGYQDVANGQAIKF